MVDRNESSSSTATSDGTAFSSLLPSNTPGASRTDDDGSSMSTGAIIGVAVGCFVLILLVACCLICTRRRRRHQEEEYDAGGIGGVGHSEHADHYSDGDGIPPLAPIGVIGDLDNMDVEEDDEVNITELAAMVRRQ